jgi:mannosyltransferase OCH1-like enzyme
MHPTWKFTTWDDYNTTDFEVASKFAQCNAWAIVADLVRIEAIYRHGGVYIDADIEPVRPIDAMIDSNSLMLTEQSDEFPGTIWNGVIAAPPKHPLIKIILDYLLGLQGEITCLTSGPTGLHAALRGYYNAIQWMPRTWFSPWDKWTHQDAGIQSETFGMHHYCAAWNLKENH